MSLGPKKIIEKKERYLLPCSYHFYKNPPQITKGFMQYLYDNDGNEYIDMFAGVSVMNCGHCNPIILEKTIEKMKTLQHTTSIYLTEEIVDLGEQLSKYLPGNIEKSFFCMSGSEANEGALLLAKLYTKKEGIIYFKNSLHGRTQLTMSITGIDMWRTMPTPSPHTYMAESFYPNVYSNEFLNAMNEPSLYDSLKKEASERALESVKAILKLHKDQIGAIIIEPIQGNGGILIPEKAFIKSLYTLAKENGILLIADEVQTGYSRTGKHFAIEHFDIVPDILTSAKALGNGVPIAAFSTTKEIASAFTRPSASTLGGNPVSAYNSQAVLNYLTSYHLDQKAEDLGNYMLEQLHALKKKYTCIRDVRGIGLMIGVELVNEKHEPLSELTDMILEDLKDNGILLGKNGIHRNVLAFQPPLVIEKSQIDDVIQKLDYCLNKHQ